MEVVKDSKLRLTYCIGLFVNRPSHSVEDITGTFVSG